MRAGGGLGLVWGATREAKSAHVARKRRVGVMETRSNHGRRRRASQPVSAVTRPADDRGGDRGGDRRSGVAGESDRGRAGAEWELPGDLRALIDLGGLEPGGLGSGGLGSGGRDEAASALGSLLRADRDLAAEVPQWCRVWPGGNGSMPSDLGEATRRHGQTAVAQMACLASIRRYFRPELRIDRYGRTQLWRHGVAVAAVSALVARVCGVSGGGSIFFAGALHDIGLLAAERLHGAAFAALVGDVDELSPMHEVERERWGWDHAMLGSQLLRRWRFPGLAVAAAAYHHDASRAIAEGVAGDEAIACISLANHLCSRTGWSSMGVHNVVAPAGPELERIGVDAGRLTRIWRALPQVLSEASTLP